MSVTGSATRTRPGRRGAMVERLEVHPIVAGIFPPIEGAAFDAFVADIKANKLQHPIVLYEDKILDGYNRHRACAAAKVEPMFTTYTGKDPLGYAISLNVRRRHLNESQRAMVAARLATLTHGGDRKSDQAANLHLDRAAAAKKLNVSERSIAHAAKVQASATKQLIGAADQGKISVSIAAQIATHDAETQDGVVKRVEAGTKPMEAFRLQKHAKINADRIRNPTGKYRIIYADPAWSYGNPQRATYSQARDHYPTMKLEDICALPVKDWAEDNAVLFLWVTSPILMESAQVIEAWGFKYKASFVWDKESPVMGHYNGVAHELLLICVRGSCQPDVRKLFNSVVREKRTGHSKKPTIFYDMIETLYPHGARLELFARTARPGWCAWGNQAEAAE
jgi:N6-adenosine-specific RNA methylase IME4